MARKARPIHLALPGKQWFQQASLLGLTVCGLALFVISKTNNPTAQKLRGGLMDVITPVLSIAASPFEAFHSLTGWAHEMVSLRDENIALKNQNRELLKWQMAAKDMQSENAALKKLLNVVPDKTNSFITARIVSNLSGPYAHSALITGGTAQGVKKNQAIISDNGLIGRVIDVSEGSARVLLLADINSRVPVMGEKTREKSILIGSNDALPQLAYLPAHSKMEVGERIVTSGDGGMFPAGIPVGVVASADKDTGDVRVQTFVDPAQINFVSAVDYAL